MKSLLKLKLHSRFSLISIFTLVILFTGCKTLYKTSHEISSKESDSIKVIQIKTDTLFDSNQIISLIYLKNRNDDKYFIDIAYDSIALIKTSEFAQSNNAIAAINGGFFDINKGGSVTYLEVDDNVISKTQNPEKKWAKSEKLINGAIILTKNNEFLIQSAKPDDYYENSKNESFVLITGPLLIRNSKNENLPDMKFTHFRHPRTCMCNTEDSLVLITVDGRQENAAGMNLFELQKYLHSIGCVNAINLDGGGSTTMWKKDKGIVNNPSDKEGERPVSNVILILEKEQ